VAGNIIVIIIVCLAAFYIGKRIYKTLSGRRVGCGCSSQEGCTTVEGCTTIESSTAVCDGNQDPKPVRNA
jgi:hypothetical protein